MLRVHCTRTTYTTYTYVDRIHVYSCTVHLCCEGIDIMIVRVHVYTYSTCTRRVCNMLSKNMHCATGNGSTFVQLQPVLWTVTHNWTNTRAPVRENKKNWSAATFAEISPGFTMLSVAAGRYSWLICAQARGTSSSGGPNPKKRGSKGYPKVKPSRGGSTGPSGVQARDVCRLFS